MQDLSPGPSCTGLLSYSETTISLRACFRFFDAVKYPPSLFFLYFNCWHWRRRPAEVMLPSKTADNVIGRLVSGLLPEWRRIQYPYPLQHRRRSFSHRSSISISMSLFFSCWGRFNRSPKKFLERSAARQHWGLTHKSHLQPCISQQSLASGAHRASCSLN